MQSVNTVPHAQPQGLTVRCCPMAALLAAIMSVLSAASAALATASESVILVEDLGVMLETRRRCGTRCRAFLATQRLQGVFIHEVPSEVDEAASDAAA